MEETRASSGLARTITAGKASTLARLVALCVLAAVVLAQAGPAGAATTSDPNPPGLSITLSNPSGMVVTGMVHVVMSPKGTKLTITIDKSAWPSTRALVDSHLTLSSSTRGGTFFDKNTVGSTVPAVTITVKGGPGTVENIVTQLTIDYSDPAVGPGVFTETYNSVWQVATTAY